MSMMSVLKSLYTVHKDFEDYPSAHFILDLWTDTYIKIYICMCMRMHILKKKENDIFSVKFWNETNSNQEIQNSGLFFGVSWHDHELKKVKDSEF